MTSIEKKRQEMTRESHETKAQKYSYFSLYRFASKCDRLLIAVSLFASTAIGCIYPYSLLLMSVHYGNIVEYERNVMNITRDEKDNYYMDALHDIAVKYSCVGVVLFVLGYLATALINIAAVNQTYRIRKAYLKAALNQDFAYYDLHKAGNFASQMSNDLIRFEEGIGENFTTCVMDFSMIIACIGMAIFKGWKLTLLCLMTTPMTFILIGVSGVITSNFSKKVSVETSQAGAVAEEVLRSIRTVYAFNGQEKELARYGERLADARKINLEMELYIGITMGFLNWSIYISYAFSLYIGVYLLVNEPDNYNAKVVIAVLTAVLNGLQQFNFVGSKMDILGSAVGATSQIFQLLNNKPSIDPSLDRGLRPNVVEGVVELKNVKFHYPTRPHDTVLRGVSIIVHRGQSVALVGASGSGKSSIIQLITRSYDVVEGSVCIDGNDVRDLSVQWLRSQIGSVGQESVLFNMSLRENIRFGCEGASDEDVERAARQANAHNFIARLSRGYDTLVGERGASLSGGQKQRIAIARALVRNPRILLLDEATSSLDNVSEDKVQRALNKATEGRSTLIIAHRLSTIRNASMIYILKNGEIVEMGNHEELMSKKGYYYDMVTLQEPYDITSKVNPDREESNTSATDSEDVSSSKGPDEINEVKPEPLSLWRVLKLCSPDWKWLIVGSIFTVFFGFGEPTLITLFGNLAGAMFRDNKRALDMGNLTLIICIALGLVMGLCAFIQGWTFGSARAYLMERLRLRMFDKLLQLDIDYYEDPVNSTGALCARLSAEAAFVHGATGQRIGRVLESVGSVSLGVVLAFLHEWRLALVVLSFLPAVISLLYQQAKMLAVESFGNSKAVENSTKVALEAVSNYREVSLLGRERLFLAKYDANLQPALACARRAAHWRGVVTGLSHSLYHFVNAAALSYGGYLVVKENLSSTHVFVTTQSLMTAITQLQATLAYLPDFQKGVIAASRVITFMKTKPTIVDPDVPATEHFRCLVLSNEVYELFTYEPLGFDRFSFLILQQKATGETSFRNVEFSYPTHPDLKVLRGLNLQVEHGQTVALVGRSGSGKTTTLSLLQRFYDPDSGTISLDGISLRKLRINDVRNSFGVVSQEPVLFDRTILENIAYGDNAREPSFGEIVLAAKQANIHDFIVSLPEGYDTVVGTKGTQLSGGQKQRVAIARALIRNPRILILDEATSALDMENEKIVHEALDKAEEGRTCLVIAHRLSTARNADNIYVFNYGRVVEHGTHQDLMQLNGIYYNLYRRGTLS